MRNKIGWHAGCALLLSMSPADPLIAAPPSPGTISVETRPVAPELTRSVPAFIGAVGDALAAHGFIIIEGAGHAGLIASIGLVRTDVGITSAKVPVGKAAIGAGGAEGVGGGMSLPLPTGKVREMALQQTRLEITIAERGGNAVLWKGAAVTVRPAEAREGRDDVVAANLAEVLLRNYPIQAAEAISIP